jgi:dienelactone hydrolase
MSRLNHQSHPPFSMSRTICFLGSAFLPLFATLMAHAAPPGVPAPPQLYSNETYAAMATIFDYDVSMPLDARVVDRLEEPSFSREKIAFTTSSGERIAGWLAIPKDAVSPPPCVLLLHGVGTNKDAWWRPDNPTGPLALRLVQSGYAVFMLDAAFFGERSHIGDFANPQRFVGKNGWFYRFRNIIVQTVIDYRRALDYLATRPDLDPQRRAVAGYSMGGVTALNLLAVEPRLTVGVACVAPPMITTDQAGDGQLAPAQVRLAPVAPANHARALGAKRVLFLMATKDEYYTPSAVEAMVNMIPGSNKSLKFFDSGHMLPHSYVDDAVQWMQTNLANGAP